MKLLTTLTILFLFINSFSQSVQSDSDIIFIDTETTLNKQLEQFKGKVVYVDVWATWCSPCIELLGHKKNYDDYFEKNDIVVLCMCIDKMQNIEKWKELINANSVKGYHIFVDNKALTEYLTDIKASRDFGKSFGHGFPRFLIVDKNGSIEVERAWAPGDKLVTQMEEYLN